MTIYSIPPFLTLCSFIWLGAVTVRHGRWTRADVLFFVICLFGAFLYTDILLVFHVASAKTALFISRVDHLFIVYLSPVYLHFFHVYLGVKNRRWLVGTAYAASFVLMCFTQTDLYIRSMGAFYFGYFALGGPVYSVFGAMTLLVSVYVLCLLYRAMQSKKSSLERYRLGYMLVGFGLMGLLNALNVFPMSGMPVYPPGNWSFIPLAVFGVGMFRHDLLDTGTLIHRGLTYTLLTSFLTAVYAAVLLGAERLISGFSRADSVTLSFGFILVAAIAAAPMKERIQVFVDRFFFRKKYDYQKTVKSVGRRITAIRDAGEIARLMLHVVSQTMQVKHCRLYLRAETGDHFIRQGAPHPGGDTVGAVVKGDAAVVGELSRRQKGVFKRQDASSRAPAKAAALAADFERLKADVVIPMAAKNRLIGFLTMGEKRSGDLFTPEDFDLLEILAGQGALAFENARAYALLRRLNADLEEAVASRTRELRQALHEKEMSQERLVKSESLAAIGELVAGAAHELNNPLASVMSLLQSSVEDLRQWDGKTQLDDDFIDDLAFARRELEKAKHIVESLLGLSRQTGTYAEDVNINAVVKNALRVLYNQYKNDKLNILENYASGLPAVRGNFANLGQVAVNIIKNAIQAVRDTGGEIAVTTRYEEKERQVVFECADTGPGIPPERRLDIFKPFYTTKPVGQGTGLGLYICHEIVQRHGGTLNLDNRSGGGAVFGVWLPVSLTG